MRLIRLNGFLLVTDEVISVDGVEAGGLDPTDRVVSLPLLCDSNSNLASISILCSHAD